MNSIQSDSTLLEASSLEYSKNDGTSYFVNARIDANNTIYKLKNTIKDTIREIIEEFYYLNSKKKISSRTVTSYETEFVLYNQVVSFYNDSGGIVYTGSRSHSNIDSIDNMVFEKYKLNIDHNDLLAQNIIQQKEEFETNFRGFINLDIYNMNFIKIGSNNGVYSSLLAVSEESPVLEELKQNENKYIGSPLRVDFMKINQADGFSYQLLLNVTMNQMK